MSVHGPLHAALLLKQPHQNIHFLFPLHGIVDMHVAVASTVKYVPTVDIWPVSPPFLMCFAPSEQLTAHLTWPVWPLITWSDQGHPQSMFWLFASVTANPETGSLMVQGSCLCLTWSGISFPFQPAQQHPPKMKVITTVWFLLQQRVQSDCYGTFTASHWCTSWLTHMLLVLLTGQRLHLWW